MYIYSNIFCFGPQNGLFNTRIGQLSGSPRFAIHRQLRGVVEMGDTQNNGTKMVLCTTPISRNIAALK